MLPQPHTRNTRRLSHAHGLASSPFAHHYSGNHYCFLFLRVLRCFTSPRYHQPPYQFRRRQHPITGARFPHSEIPGSTLGCQLPGAYRRLPRPSSAPGAKASTVCPKKLEHTRQNFKDARVHYAVLKTRTEPTPSHHQTTNTHPRKKRHDINAVWRPDQPASHRTPPHREGPGPRKPSVSSGPNSVPRPAGPSDHVPTPRSCSEEQHPRRY
jgi:hypothetical protein